MNKAHTELQIKSFDEGEGVFIGIASTPTPDRVKDVVDPNGAIYSLPIPLLAYHDHEKTIGTVEQVSIKDTGIEVVCRVLKDVTQEAKEIWGLIQNGAMKGLSIGFKSLDAEPLSGGGYLFKKYEWLELSVVPVAMNGQASITATKSATVIQQKGKTSMSISEQIQQFQTKRAEVLATMDALVTKGVTLTGDDDDAFKAAEAEVASIDAHIERLKAAEARQAKTAQPITIPVAQISVESNMPKGVGFIAACKALSHANNNPMYAVELAKEHYKDYPQVEQFIRAKSAIGAATTTSHTALTTPGALASEFIGLLNNAQIVGRLSGFRQVPHGVKIPRLATGAAGYWVGESKPIPLTGNSVDDIEIGRFKIASIATMSRELLMIGNPAIDALLRDNIIEAAAKASDDAFILSTNAGSGIKPAAITYGLTPVASSGVGPQHVRADVKKALDKFTIANQGTDGATWLMHSVTASALTFMRTAAGAPAFPGMTIDGGTLLGLPVLVSNSVPGDGASGYDMVLIKASEIFRPIAPGIDVFFSNEASLEMDTSLLQDGAAGTGASLVSMFQNDMTAVRVIQFDGWHPRRTPCAVRVSGAKYDETVIEAIATVAA